MTNAANPRSVVRIEYASDERLAQAIGYNVRDRVSEGVRSTNTVLTFPLSVEVDAPGEMYLRAYPYAAAIVANIVDVLRIVHDGDIGVGALRLVAVDPFTPTIRRTLAWSYEPEVTLYQARRMAFGTPLAEVLTDDEIDVARRLLPIHLEGLQQQGFDVAIQRFRDSYERYQPSDSGRLLDIAIAFEALLLSDSPQKELSHRLAVRGARWLEVTLDARRATFTALKALYDVRSMIAHGVELSANDQKRRDLAMALAPGLLRKGLQYALEGRGPVGLKKEPLRRWWQDVELG